MAKTRLRSSARDPPRRAPSLTPLPPLPLGKATLGVIVFVYYCLCRVCLCRECACVCVVVCLCACVFTTRGQEQGRDGKWACQGVSN